MAKQSCTIDGCDKPRLARGWCPKHYRRWQIHGDPLTVKIPKHRKRGDGTINAYGYCVKSKNGKRYMAHRQIAAEALGRPLSRKEQVHHIDGNPLNNEPNNLVICPDYAYHSLLHKRERAYNACGNPDWLVCDLCGTHDDPDNLSITSKNKARHRSCSSEYARQHRAKKRMSK